VEDADRISAELDAQPHTAHSRFDVEELEGAAATDLAPVIRRGLQECQYVVTGGFHHGHGSWELLAQHLG